MQGLSERQYAAHRGVSRGAVQKARTSGRLALHADGSIDAVSRGYIESTAGSKTRAEVRADLAQARMSGELPAIDAEAHGVHAVSAAPMRVSAASTR